SGYDHDALVVAYQHVPRAHLHAAATDREVDVFGVMGDEVRVGVHPTGVARHVEAGDEGAVPERAVRDDAGSAAHLHPRDEHAAHGAGSLIDPRVDDQHLTGFDLLGYAPLWVVRALPVLECLEIVTAGDVAQRARDPDHLSATLAQAANAAYHLVLETVDEQLRGQRGGARLAE